MKKCLVISLFFLFTVSLFSQSNSSLIVGLGPNKMSGDIGGDNFGSLFKNDFGIGSTLAYRFVFPFNVGLRVYGDYEYYRGKDSKVNNGRKWDFTSSVGSLGGQLEYVIYGNNYLEKQIPHSVYLFGGAEKIFYNALFNGLTNVNTKGNTTGLFAGMGYQYRFSDNLSVGLELKQTLYQSDKVDGYFPDPALVNNRYDDMAFTTKIIVCYNIPIYSGPKHWDIDD